MKTISVFHFYELSADAQRKAADTLRDINVDSDWSEWIIGDWVELLNAIGFQVDAESIRFNGFGSQGDGASFHCRIDLAKLASILKSPPSPDGESPDLVKRLAHNISVFPEANAGAWSWLDWCETENWFSCSIDRRSFRYCHEKTCVTDHIADKSRRVEDHSPLAEKLDRLRDDIESIRLACCRAMFKELEAAYNDLTGHDAIVESIIANDYYFDAKGNLVDE